MGSGLDGLGKVFDPGTRLLESAFGEDSSVAEFSNTLSDPVDLWGNRARKTRDTISGIQYNSALDSITAQENMLKTLEDMFSPYEQFSSERFGDYLNMTTGGDQKFTPSETYDYNKEQGVRGINRYMASKGLYGSSGRGASLADYLVGLGQDESAKQYARNLDVQQLGTDAISNMGQASGTAGTNISSIYGNLGNAMNTLWQNYGNSRAQSAKDFSGVMGGVSKSMGGIGG